MNPLLIILLVAVITFALRAFPFMLFGGRRKPSRHIKYIGMTLPAAVIGVLVVYCLRDANASTLLPKVIAVVATALLHLWKRNNLLSIGGGTVCYMLLLQLVF